MKSWPQMRLGDFGRARGGKRLPKGFEVQDEPTEHPYIRVVDMRDDGVDVQTVKFISNEAYERVQQYTISNEEIYISIAGTIGRVGMVPQSLSGANLTENAAKVGFKDSRLEPRFVMYFLRSAHGQGLIRSSIGGTSQPKLALYRIEDMKIPMPPLRTQRCIASILSAYDNLIENNLRRIKLLEESARLLYKEWFVRLRFPGHEHTRIINGVPEGWERKKLGELIELKYGKSLKEEDRIEGPYPVYGSSGIVGTHEECLVTGPGIIVGRKGNAGTVFWSPVDFFPIDTVYYVESVQSNYFLLHNLRHQNFQSSHGAVPGLNREYAHSLSIVMPPESLRDQFQELASVLYDQMHKLSTMNGKLRQARDVLLPKLMSGEIQVIPRG